MGAPVFHVQVPLNSVPSHLQTELLEKIRNTIANMVSEKEAKFIVTAADVKITKLL